MGLKLRTAIGLLVTVALCYLDYRLSHLDELWATDSATKQWLMYAIFLFFRIVTIWVTMILVLLFKVRVHWSIPAVMIAYFMFSNYEFVEFVNGQFEQLKSVTGH